MDLDSWIAVSFADTVGIFLTVFLLNVGILILVRLNGLRTFSKMSAHDFAVTIACGSILGGAAVSPSPSVGNAIVALAFFIGLQNLYARWRRNRPTAVLENCPVIIAKDGIIFEENLKKTRMTKQDVYAKMREANVNRMSDLKVAVLEVTGDVSIIHSCDGYDEEILTGVEEKAQDFKS